MTASYGHYLATRSALSPVALLGTVIASLAGAWVIAPEASTQQRLLWMSLGAVGSLPAAAIYGLGSWWVRDTVGPTWRVVIVLVLAWVTRGVVLAGGASAVGLVDTTSAAGRVTGATLTMVSWGLALGSLVEARRQYRRSLSARHASERMLKSVYDDLRNPLDREIADDLRQLSGHVASGMSADGVGDEGHTEWARDAVEHRVRPMAHKYWELGHTDYPRSTWLRAYLARLVRQELRWPAVLVIFTCGLAVTVPFRAPVPMGVSFVVLVILAIAGAWLIVDRTAAHRTWRAPGTTLIYAFAGTAVLLLASSITESLAHLDTTDGVGRGALVVSLWADILVVLAVGAALALADERLTDLDLSSLDLRLAIQREVNQRRSMQVSTRLHNEVQPRLTAALLRVAADGDDEAFEVELLRIRELIEGAGTTRQSAGDDALARLVDAMTAWAGVADVQLEVSPEVDARDDRVEPMCSMVKELVANSIRHGRAKHVWVRLSHEGGPLRAEVTDDGRWVESRQQGIGHALAADAGLHIDRASTPEGTRVILTSGMSACSPE